MAVESKIGLVVGLGFITCFAVVLSHRGSGDQLSARMAYDLLSKQNLDDTPPAGARGDRPGDRADGADERSVQGAKSARAASSGGPVEGRRAGRAVRRPSATRRGASDETSAGATKRGVRRGAGRRERVGVHRGAGARGNAPGRRAGDSRAGRRVARPATTRRRDGGEDTAPGQSTRPADGGPVTGSARPRGGGGGVRSKGPAGSRRANPGGRPRIKPKTVQPRVPRPKASKVPTFEELFGLEVAASEGSKDPQGQQAEPGASRRAVVTSRGEGTPGMAARAMTGLRPGAAAAPPPVEIRMSRGHAAPPAAKRLAGSTKMSPPGARAELDHVPGRRTSASQIESPRREARLPAAGNGRRQAGNRSVRSTTRTSGTPGTAKRRNDSRQRDGMRYVVKRGDTLWDICARVYGVHSRKAVDAVFAANRDHLRSPDDLRVGIELTLPVVDGIGRPGRARAAGRTAPKAVLARQGQPRYYQIRPGDRYTTIAERFLGSKSRWKEIHELNKDIFPDPGKIRTGVRIRLPSDSRASSS